MNLWDRDVVEEDEDKEELTVTQAIIATILIVAAFLMAVLAFSSMHYAYIDFMTKVLGRR